MFFFVVVRLFFNVCFFLQVSALSACFFFVYFVMLFVFTYCNLCVCSFVFFNILLFQVPALSALFVCLFLLCCLFLFIISSFLCFTDSFLCVFVLCSPMCVLHTLIEHPYRTPLSKTLIGNPYRTPLSNTLIENTYRKPLSKTLIDNPYRKPLPKTLIENLINTFMG